VVHGDDWHAGVQQQTRQQVVDMLAQWGGVLIEPAYTKGVSSTDMRASIERSGLSPFESI
jgi:phosphoenolpyruvate phosphomutase